MKVTVRFNFSDLSRNDGEDAQCILEDEAEVYEGVFTETDARDQFDVSSITEEEGGISFGRKSSFAAIMSKVMTHWSYLLTYGR